MPVVKNDWDIYKSQRQASSRRTSESSRKASGSTRSECPSLSTSPGSAADFFSPAHRSSGPVNMRTSSRASLQSPSKVSSSTTSASSSPPKSNGSQSSLNKFHSRLVDRLKRSFRSSSDASSRSSSWDERGRLLQSPKTAPDTPPPPPTQHSRPVRIQQRRRFASQPPPPAASFWLIIHLFGWTALRPRLKTHETVICGLMTGARYTFLCSVGVLVTWWKAKLSVLTFNFVIICGGLLMAQFINVWLNSICVDSQSTDWWAPSGKYRTPTYAKFLNLGKYTHIICWCCIFAAFFLPNVVLVLPPL